MVSPNAIKVLLPQGSEQTSAKPMARVIIDKNLNYYGAFGKEDEMPLSIDEVPAFCKNVRRKNPKCMWLCMLMNQFLTERWFVY